MSEYIKKEDIILFIEEIKDNKNIPKNYGTLLDIIRYIRKMPTFNLDNILQQLDNSHINCYTTGDYKYNNAIDKAIEIIEQVQ